jgi:hypothetical protein
MNTCAGVSVLAVVAFLASACGPSAVPGSPSPTAISGLPLPTLEPWPFPSNSACGGVQLGPTLTLQGSPADGVYAQWGDRRLPTRWPPGYVAQFTPNLVVRAPDGTVAATAGTDLTVGRIAGLTICTGGPGGPETLVVAFLPY